MQFEEFSDCLTWWKKRKPNDRAWKVGASVLLETGCNLDQKNPCAKEDITHLPPHQLIDSILKKEQRIAELLGAVKDLLKEHLA
jgi:type I restriction enzyme M protein